MDYKKDLAAALSNASALPAEDILPMIEIPADPAMGDYAFPCFRLAKTLRKAPPAIAADITEKLDVPPFISDTQVVGAYINFFINRQQYIEDVFKDVQRQGANFGGSDVGAGRVVCIDYSSINLSLIHI